MAHRLRGPVPEAQQHGLAGGYRETAHAAGDTQQVEMNEQDQHLSPQIHSNRT